MFRLNYSLGIVWSQKCQIKTSLVWYEASFGKSAGTIASVEAQFGKWSALLFEFTRARRPQRLKALSVCTLWDSYSVCIGDIQVCMVIVLSGSKKLLYRAGLLDLWICTSLWYFLNFFTCIFKGTLKFWFKQKDFEHFWPRATLVKHGLDKHDFVKLISTKVVLRSMVLTNKILWILVLPNMVLTGMVLRNMVLLNRVLSNMYLKWS
jgi:hypothetical protein